MLIMNRKGLYIDVTKITIFKDFYVKNLQLLTLFFLKES